MPADNEAPEPFSLTATNNALMAIFNDLSDAKRQKHLEDLHKVSVAIDRLWGFLNVDVIQGHDGESVNGRAARLAELRQRKDASMATVMTMYLDRISSKG